MIFENRKQFNTYTWYDGIYLGIIWTGAFACYLGGFSFPLLTQFCSMLVLCTPFFVAYRLRLFRKEALADSISFIQGMLYCFRVYLNGAVLFGILQYLYFAYLDKGKFLQHLLPVIESPEGKKIFQSMGYDTDQLAALLPQVMQPFNIVISSFFYEMFFGFWCALVISLIMSRKKAL